jgi:hypothetical protein
MWQNNVKTAGHFNNYGLTGFFGHLNGGASEQALVS